MKARRIIPVLLLGLLLLGCGGDDGASRALGKPERTTGTPGILVTGEDPTLPEACRPRRVAALVLAFVDAFNRGDRAELSQLFFVSEGPAPPDFASSSSYPWSWFSVSEVGPGGRVEHSFTTFNQGEMLRYLEERHRRGERLRLLKVSLTHTGMLGEEDNIGLIFALNRYARDLAPGLGGPSRVAFGQGAVSCREQRIFQWSLEMSAAERRTGREAAAWICEEPSGWRPGQTVVACA